MADLTLERLMHINEVRPRKDKHGVDLISTCCHRQAAQLTMRNATTHARDAVIV